MSEGMKLGDAKHVVNDLLKPLEKPLVNRQKRIKRPCRHLNVFQKSARSPSFCSRCGAMYDEDKQEWVPRQGVKF